MSKMKIIANKLIASKTFEITLKAQAPLQMVPGQFVNIQIAGVYLRRPISICSIEKKNLVLIYKVVGKGTKILSEMGVGVSLDILCNLGNGYENLNCKLPLLIGGGMGIPPLYELAKVFYKKGITLNIVLGFNKSADIFYVKKFEEFGTVHICTMDGSLGFKGNVVEFLNINKIDFDQYYSCGPTIMLEKIQEFSKKGYVSLESNMACGFGYCQGCACEIGNKMQRICVEGPVFKVNEVNFLEFKN